MTKRICRMALLPIVLLAVFGCYKFEDALKRSAHESPGSSVIFQDENTSMIVRCVGGTVIVEQWEADAVTNHKIHSFVLSPNKVKCIP